MVITMTIRERTQVLKNEEKAVQAQISFYINVLNIAKVLVFIMAILIAAEVYFAVSSQLKHNDLRYILFIVVSELVAITAFYFTIKKLSSNIKSQTNLLNVIHEAVQPREMCKKITGKLINYSSTPQFKIANDIFLHQARFETIKGGIINVLIEPFQYNFIFRKEEVTLDVTRGYNLVKGMPHK